MKKVLLISLIIFFALNMNVFGQNLKEDPAEFKISELVFFTGKTALGLGLDGKVTFTKGNYLISVQANDDRVIVNLGKKFGNLQVAESFGVKTQIPWTGPQIIYQIGPLDLMAWNGLGFFDPKDKTLATAGFYPKLLLSYESAGLTFLKTNKIGVAVLWFKEDPMNWFLSYKKTFPINKFSSIYGEITYNHNLNLPLFAVGCKFKF